MKDILLDTTLDTLKILPFLFLTYLFLEITEHTTGDRMTGILQKHRKEGPLLGTLLGLVPECGFSSAASSLYTTGVISAGTLVSVFLSTSDEMIPIMVSMPQVRNKILPILLVKILVSIPAGYFADRILPKNKYDIESLCQREHCDCEHGNVFHSALHHTMIVFFWIYSISFLFNFGIDAIGMEAIKSHVQSHHTISLLLSILIGFIPSCASSVLLTTLYLENIISFAAICTGLLVNAGSGMIVLLHTNKNRKENVSILLYLTAIAFLTGLLISL